MYTELKVILNQFHLISWTHSPLIQIQMVQKNTAKPLLQLVTVINPNDTPTVDHHYGPEMHHIAINNLPFNSSTADMKRRLCHGKSCAI